MQRHSQTPHFCCPHTQYKQHLCFIKPPTQTAPLCGLLSPPLMGFAPETILFAVILKRVFQLTNHNNASHLMTPSAWSPAPLRSKNVAAGFHAVTAMSAAVKPWSESDGDTHERGNITALRSVERKSYRRFYCEPPFNWLCRWHWGTASHYSKHWGYFWKKFISWLILKNPNEPFHQFGYHHKFQIKNYELIKQGGYGGNSVK